jgi:hypothetical protein
VIGLTDLKCRQAKRVIEADTFEDAVAVLSENHTCTDACYHLDGYELVDDHNIANAMGKNYLLRRTVNMGGTNPPMNVVRERLSVLATPVDFLSRWMQLEKDLFTVITFDGEPIFNFNVQVYGSGNWQWRTARLNDILLGSEARHGNITTWYEEYMPWIRAIKTDRGYMDDITTNVPLPYVQSLSTAALDAEVTTENGDIIAKPYRESMKATVRTAATIQWWKALADKFGIESRIKIMENRANLGSIDLENLGTLGYMVGAGKTNGGRKSNYWYTTDFINAGVALSSLYKPLYTNVYDMPFIDIVNDDLFTMFVNKFGRMRKAVMIETSSGSVAAYLTRGSYNKFRVCTLRDLLENPGHDKLLVVQDTYYNRHKVPVGRDLIELSELKDMSNGSQSLREIHNEAVEESARVDDAAGDREVNTTRGSSAQVEVSTIVGHLDIWRDYSYSYAKDSLNSFFEVAQNVCFSKFVTGLEDDTLNIYLGLDAMVHSKQRYDKVDWVSTGQDNLYHYIKDDINRPVWMSAARYIAGNNVQNDSASWNYMLLTNLANSIAIRYTSNLDLDSPLFVDIFGNIITESGIVVIPAAANGTLNTRVNLLTAAFLLNYGKVESIKRNDLNENTRITIGRATLRDMGRFAITDFADYVPGTPSSDRTFMLLWDRGSKSYMLNTALFNFGDASDFDINIRYLNSADPATMELLYKINLSLYQDNFFNQVGWYPQLDIRSFTANIVMNVLRGAPIENIDYEIEGLSASRSQSPQMLMQAARYESLRASLLSDAQNAILAIPNLAFMEHTETLIFFAYRVMIILAVFAVMLQIYYAAVRAKLTLMTVLSVVLNMAFVIVAIVVLPFIFEMTYYQANKALLQDEVFKFVSLTSEKRNNGVELGVLQTTNQDISTRLLLKVDRIDVPIFQFLRDITYTADIRSMQQLYDRHIGQDMIAALGTFETYGDGIYMTVDNLLESSSIVTDPERHLIYQVVKPNNHMSFWMPYYAIVEYLCRNVNIYNYGLGSFSYDMFNYGDGTPRSIDIISRYLRSDAFLLTSEDISKPSFVVPENYNEQMLTMASFDKIGVFQFYNMKMYDNRSFFTEREKAQFKTSQWYWDDLSHDELLAKVRNLDRKAVDFVLRNESLIGRMSDETFIKTFALYMALEYNKEFNVPGPRDIEIYNMSTEDLMRLSIATPQKVIENSPYNYPRFLLEIGGPAAIYLGCALELILTLSAWAKPAVTLGIFAALLLSIFVYRVLLNRKSNNMKGFAKFTLILCGGNVLYALVIKVSLLFAGWGFPPLVCLILQIILHSAYLWFYIWLGATVVRNWKDLGNARFDTIVNATNMSVRNQNITNTKTNTLVYENSETGTRAGSETGWELYERMKRDDDYRTGRTGDDDDA